MYSGVPSMPRSIGFAGSRTMPHFVAMNAPSRLPWSARPTSSSFV
jgi:hypothetical protein